MTKAEIVHAVYTRLGGFSKKESADLVDLLFETMKETLGRGEKVKISGFGNFVLRDKRKRQGRNPQTGLPIVLWIAACSASSRARSSSTRSTGGARRPRPSATRRAPPPPRRSAPRRGLAGPPICEYTRGVGASFAARKGHSCMSLAVVTGAPGWLGTPLVEALAEGGLVSLDHRAAAPRPLRRAAGGRPPAARAARTQRRGRPRGSPRRPRARGRVRRRDHRLPRGRHRPPAPRAGALRHQRRRDAQHPRTPRSRPRRSASSWSARTRRPASTSPPAG